MDNEERFAQYRKRHGGVMSIDELVAPRKKLCAVAFSPETTIDDLVQYLIDTKDSERVVQYIRERWPKSKITYISNIRSKLASMDIPCAEFDVQFDHAMSIIDLWISDKGIGTDRACILNVARKCLIDFQQMTCTDRQAIQKALRRDEGYSGDDQVDSLICDMPIFPKFWNDLSLTSKEFHEFTSYQKNKVDAKGSDLWTVDVNKSIREAYDTLMYNRANIYDKAVAVAFVTGRRMVEIFKQGSFEACENDDARLRFSGQVKRDRSVANALTGVDDDHYIIPTLVSAQLILSNIELLRKEKNCDALDNREVNGKYAGGCNSAARRFLGADRKYHDLRSAYSVVTYECSRPHKWSQPKWISTMLGHNHCKGSVSYATVNVENILQEHKFIWPEAM
jgi:hypothetical protein